MKKDYRFRINKNGLIENFLKVQFSEKGDSYLFPYLPSNSILSKTGAHISFHASGQSHIRMNYPISCFKQGPKLKLLFDKTEFWKDIIIKRNLLFQPLNLEKEKEGGIISRIKITKLIQCLTHYFAKLFDNKKFVDYYNLSITNHYLPSSFFFQYFHPFIFF
jgi:hypothetical protein